MFGVPKKRLPSRHHRCSQNNRCKGLTAVETMISLLIISLVALFILNGFSYWSRLHVQAQQNENAAQIGRDCLQLLRAGVNLADLSNQLGTLARGGTLFDLTWEAQPASDPDVANVELTITWLPAWDNDQAVFNTSVFTRQVPDAIEELVAPAEITGVTP